MMKTKGYFRNSQKNDLFWEGKFCSTLPLVVFLFGFDLKFLWFCQQYRCGFGWCHTKSVLSFSHVLLDF